ncbi:hypothetical protein B0H13DRAFT_1859716 [Mycena leptocephala]|nr:hypothetical protein B0H13DRAFT_1871860 [Mycena leptocephala]KAJ7929502.1 hypothetical protein B0H13DRAFT_1859716 [Mycena leptocephala]
MDKQNPQIASIPEFDASSHLELNDPSRLQFSARLQKIIPQSNNVRLDGAIVPNALHGRASFSEAHEKLLTLADSGLDGANIQLQPLLVKARGIWVIIAHDATADKEDNFADGTAMIVHLVIALHIFLLLFVQAESRRRATHGRVRFFPVADLLMDVLGCWGQEIPEFHQVHPDGGVEVPNGTLIAHAHQGIVAELLLGR